MKRRLGPVLAIACVLIGCGSDEPAAETPSPSWELRAPMEVDRSEIAAAVRDGQIYVAGGIQQLGLTDQAEVYDEATDGWSRAPALPRALHHVAMVGCGGEVYASGGYTSLTFERDEDPTLWRLGANGWDAVTSLPEPLGEHAMACIDGSVHIVGGNTDDGPTGAFRRWDAPTWVDLPSLPTPRHSTAVAVVDGWLYVFGGRDESSSQLDVVEAFDVAAGAWEARAPLPVGRGGHAAAASGGVVHVVGGELLGDDVVLDLHDLYDAATDTWTSGPPLPEARHGLAAVTIGERIYAIGGGSEAGVRTVASTTGTLQVLGDFE